MPTPGFAPGTPQLNVGVYYSITSKLNVKK